MHIVSDLHIHSPYSRATSSRLSVPYLDRWARIKGIGLIGTGDCTHPQWLSELRENLDDAEPGLFTIKNNIQAAFDSGPALAEEIPAPGAMPSANSKVRFVLTGEISTIYSRNGKTRKVHHVVVLPDFRAAALFNTKLERIGNIRSDGRPILGLDSRDLFSILLEADERSLLIPAHIWTPWFSALGAKSGFDSIEECYGDLSKLIPAVETGLSSDPSMNWSLSSLDRYSIISNSDAHSPDKLGREATIFDMELSYKGLRDAIFQQTEAAGFAANGKPGIIATVEFFPEEGKYHYDGHRKCGVCLTPADAVQSWSGEMRCPVCGKALTRGVMGRVMELADRPLDDAANALHSLRVIPANAQGNRRPFYSLIPLKEILGELLGTGPSSKKVCTAYFSLIEKAGSELAILKDMDIDSIAKINAGGISPELLSQAIHRMRCRQVSITAGYDGEYGVIRVFPQKSDNVQETKGNGQKSRTMPTAPSPLLAAPSPLPIATPSFSSEQQEIIKHEGRRALIIAGPGTGKTAVLAARIAKLIDSGVNPASILALSFTVKAAGELRERIGSMRAKDSEAQNSAGNKGNAGGEVFTATFHSFCASVLREQANTAGIPAHFEITGEARRMDILTEICNSFGKKNSPAALGRYIEGRKRFLLLPGEDKPKALAKIQEFAAVSENAQTGAAPPDPKIIAIPAPVPELETLYSVYRGKLNDMNLLDYDDLIAGTARLLAAKEKIRAKYREKFSWIFVDEYQDINVSQYILLKLLTDTTEIAANAGHQLPEARPSLWVIGDPNQAIYGFRGSDKRFIDRFMHDYPDAQRFELARSFRCAQPIISAAAQLTGAHLKGTAQPVYLRRAEYPSDKSEAEGIARSISRLIGGTSFFALDSDDGQDNSGRDSAAASPAGTYANHEDTAAPGDCAILIRAAPLAVPIIKALKDHGIPYNFCDEQPWWEEEPVKTFLGKLQTSSAPEEEFQKGKQNPKLTRLFELAEMTGGITPLLDALAISDSGDIPEYNREGVHIMTIHAAKGLEFDHVFVPGCEDGILPFTLFGGLPGGQAERPDLIDEERRLLYVAMTRARIGLALSWARKRNFKGRQLQGNISPFLNQLGQIIPLIENKKVLKKTDQLYLFNHCL